MIVLGLTGSIGMGKSAAAAMFQAEGVPVFDADAEVHRMQASGGALVQAIEAIFPGSAVAGGIDRTVLSRYVIGDVAALHRLERLIHPAVGLARQAFLRRNQARRLVVLDIPLLFEKGHKGGLDAIAVVSAPVWKQRRRVLARPGMTVAKFDQILKLQLPDHLKRQHADFIIDTGGERGKTHAQIRRIIACLVKQ